MSERVLQSALASFVADAPAGWGISEARDELMLSWLDTVAVSIAGTVEDVSQRVSLYLDTVNTDATTLPLWGARRALTLEGVALSFGTSAHALDYDDVTSGWRGHPSAVIFSALAALSVPTRASLLDMFKAYIVGFEVGAVIGQRVAGRHYEHGWHATSTIGVLAATAAGCRLLGLSSHNTSNALGLAVAQAAGVQANFGTDAKALHAGFAAAAAVRACLLAKSGIASSPRALDGPSGFLDLYVDGRSTSEIQVDVDSPCAIARFGIERKAYPMCYAAHRAIDAALQIRTVAGFAVEKIERLEILGSSGAHVPLLKRLPNDGDEARFSVEFGVACALIDGRVGLMSFNNQVVARAVIHDLMVRTSVSETATREGGRCAIVRAFLQGGGHHERTCTAPTGLRTSDAVDAKLADCLAIFGLDDLAPSIRSALEERVSDPLADVLALPVFECVGEAVRNAATVSPNRMVGTETAHV